MLCCMPRGAGLGGPRRPPWPHGTPCKSPWEGARGAKGAFRAHRTPGPGTGPPPWSPGAPESPGHSRIPGGAPWGPASRPTWPHGGGPVGPGGHQSPRGLRRSPGGPRGLQGPPGTTGGALWGPGAFKAHLVLCPEPPGTQGGPPGRRPQALGSFRYGNLWGSTETQGTPGTPGQPTGPGLHGPQDPRSSCGPPEDPGEF